MGYSYFAAFYKASALEAKRLGMCSFPFMIFAKSNHIVDGILRSTLYSHLSESLTGLPTVRSYGELPWFIHNNQYFIDLENRALVITVANQRSVVDRQHLPYSYIILDGLLFGSTS